MTELYNCKAEPNGQFRMTKFDGDLNVIASYALTHSECECPAGARPSCRHRKMLPRFLQRKQVDTPWFYDYHGQGWVHLTLLQGWAEPEAESGVVGASPLNSAEGEGEVTHPLATPDPAPQAAPRGFSRRGL